MYKNRDVLITSRCGERVLLKRGIASWKRGVPITSPCVPDYLKSLERSVPITSPWVIVRKRSG